MLVLLEQIQEQNRATIEAVVSSEQKTGRRIDELDVRLTRRVEALELAVQMNSADIRQNSADIQEMRVDIQKNSVDIQEMRGDIREMRGDIQEMRGDIQEMRGDIHRMDEDLRNFGVQLQGKADRTNHVG